MTWQGNVLLFADESIIGNFGKEKKKIIRIFRFRFLFDVLKEMKNIREIELTYEFQIIFFFFLEIVLRGYFVITVACLINKFIKRREMNFSCLSLEKFFPAES